LQEKKYALNGSVEIVQDMFVKTLLGVSPPAHPPPLRRPPRTISVEKVKRMVE
jgi:hypothetical protein